MSEHWTYNYNDYRLTLVLIEYFFLEIKKQTNIILSINKL